MTYECRVCWNVNHASRLHCATCGTIPAQYSFASVPVTDHGDYYLEILVAYGAERQVTRRTIKRIARTVPMDYYASE